MLFHILLKDLVDSKLFLEGANATLPAGAHGYVDSL
jgi:hypothetical protein